MLDLKSSLGEVFEYLGVISSLSLQTGLKQGTGTGVGCPERYCGYRPD